MRGRSKDTAILERPQSELTPAAFKDICELVYVHSGISLGENKQPLVRARIQKRMRALGLQSYDDYVKRVRADKHGDEVQQLVDAISTNVTSFYREKKHFDFMREVIAEWSTAGRKKLRIWSSACSTGEEPYNIAMEVLETIGARRYDVKILATDIAGKVLLETQAGQYTEQEVEPIPIELRQKYFEKVSGTGGVTYRVVDKLKQMIHVRQHNLTSFPYSVSGPMDFIFCRNVMIYFDRPTRTEIIREFSRIIRPGGYLFVGHSESLSGMTSDFRAVQPTIYQRA